MDSDECRKRAILCSQQAARSWGTLQLNFLTAAETWLQLALQLDRLDKQPILLVTKVKEDSSQGR
jgi:hypothetical protein